MSDKTNELAQAILAVTAPITHMFDLTALEPGEPPNVRDVVRRVKQLLEDVLAPLEADHDVEAATIVLDAAMPLIMEAIFVAQPPNRRERRHPPRRRHQRH
jgi:hypothetical protein